jgi:hypothetical protein
MIGEYLQKSDNRRKSQYRYKRDTAATCSSYHDTDDATEHPEESTFFLTGASLSEEHTLIDDTGDEQRKQEDDTPGQKHIIIRENITLIIRSHIIDI